MIKKSKLKGNPFNARIDGIEKGILCRFAKAYGLTKSEALKLIIRKLEI